MHIFICHLSWINGEIWHRASLENKEDFSKSFIKKLLGEDVMSKEKTKKEPQKSLKDKRRDKKEKRKEKTVMNL